MAIMATTTLLVPLRQTLLTPPTPDTKLLPVVLPVVTSLWGPQVEMGKELVENFFPT